ncbi:outer membrane protein transport protein [Aliagarivorans taiwanensis]|uniref:outer membrane protein transport protein n=1 Tax=Aliagarivorans taiwanensis TaxID=561966 RepID=UPI0004795926|nr:outer membrane protein transport protein [Aliagarivorans taiwanensis]
MTGRMFRPSVVGAAIALAASQAHSAGFQLVEHSATGAGRVFAGEAVIADNASVLARNPAAMARFDRISVSGALTYIAPDVYVRGNYASAPSDEVNNSTLTNNDVVPGAPVPAGYFIQPLNDKWAWGFAMFSNFGLASEFPADYPAGALAGETHLITVNLNPNVSYRINEQWSIGAGFNAVYGDAELKRNFGVNDSGIPAGATSASLKGDGWGFGWNIGLMWELNENHRFGLAYRSKIDVDFEGDYYSDLPEGLIAGPNGPAGTSGQNIPGELTLNLPDMLEFSGYHRLNEKFAVHYSYMWIGWSTFQEIRGTTEEYGTVLQKDEKFSNSYRVGVGGTWYMNPKWELRAGVSFDRTPSRTLPSISIPDNNRWNYGAGATYHWSDHQSFDAGFFFIHGKKGAFVEEEIPFTSKGNAYVISMQYNHSF